MLRSGDACEKKHRLGVFLESESLAKKKKKELEVLRAKIAPSLLQPTELIHRGELESNLRYKKIQRTQIHGHTHSDIHARTLQGGEKSTRSRSAKRSHELKMNQCIPSSKRATTKVH